MADPESACTLTRVYCLTESEITNGDLKSVSIDENSNQVTLTTDSGAEMRLTVDHLSSNKTPVEDVYQDSLYPFTEAIFQGYSTIFFNFGLKKHRDSFIFDLDSDDQGLLNLAVEQIFTNVKASSGSGVEFLVHVSIFSSRKDKV